MTLNEILTDTCQKAGLTPEEIRDKKHEHAIARNLFCRRAIDLLGNRVSLRMIANKINYGSHSSVVSGWKNTYQIKEFREKYDELWPSNK